MFRAANFARERNELLETQMVSRFAGHAKAIPGGAAVHSDCASFDLRLECGERITHHSLEVGPIEHLQPLLRAVKAGNVDHFQRQSVAAPLDLLVELGRAETGSAS